MKHILDPRFHYRPSFDTDVKKTFDKVRRQLRAKARPSQPQVQAHNVLKLDGRKKAGTSS